MTIKHPDFLIEANGNMWHLPVMEGVFVGKYYDNNPIPWGLVYSKDINYFTISRFYKWLKQSG